MSRDWKPLMQKVWSSIVSWKEKHVSLWPPAPAPAQGARSREQGVERTWILTFTTYCSAVSLYSWCPIVKLIWGKLDSLLQSTRNCMACADWDGISLPFFKCYTLNARLLWQAIVNLLQRNSIRLTCGPTLPSGFPVPALDQTSLAAQTTVPKALNTQGWWTSSRAPKGTRWRETLGFLLYNTKAKLSVWTPANPY